MPRFQRAPARAIWPPPEPGVCYLKDDNWDDFGFKTLFELGVVTSDSTFHKIGHVKVTQRGLESGRVRIPDEFDALDDASVRSGGIRTTTNNLPASPAVLAQRFFMRCAIA